MLVKNEEKKQRKNKKIQNNKKKLSFCFLSVLAIVETGLVAFRQDWWCSL
jgi:hypothetical protein